MRSLLHNIGVTLRQLLAALIAERRWRTIVVGEDGLSDFFVLHARSPARARRERCSLLSILTAASEPLDTAGLLLLFSRPQEMRSKV
jgi:hypothetical protein